MSYNPHAAYNQGAPPPPGFAPPPQYQAQQPATVIVQHVQHTTAAVGMGPTRVTCPSCHAQIMTTVRTEATTRTHVIALLLFFFACWPCVCLPYCMDSCQNANHYCPNCNAYIGTYAN